MISSVDVKVAGEPQKLRLTTRAMVALEERFDQSLQEVFAGLEGNPRITVLVQILAEIMADGAGASGAEAVALVDEIGLEAAGEAIGAAAEKAFPEAPEAPAGAGSTTKNRPRAGRKK